MLDLTRWIEVQHQKKEGGEGLYRVLRCSVLLTGSKQLYICVTGNCKNCERSSGRLQVARAPSELPLTRAKTNRLRRKKTSRTRLLNNSDYPPVPPDGTERILASR